MKRIGFDIDGVLYPWHLYVYYDLYNSGKIDYTYEYFWKHMWMVLPEKDFWTPTAERLDLLMGEFYDGAVDIVKQYIKNYDVFYLSTRPDNTVETTYNQLLKYGFPNSGRLVISHDKRGVLESNPTDYFVEDKESNIRSIYDLTQVVGVKQPWNESFFEQSKFMKILWINHILELPRVIPLEY